MSATPGKTPATNRGSVLGTVRAVAWSFLGIRRGQDFQDDIKKLNPLHIMAVGFVGCVVLVGGLIALVKWVAMP